MFQVTFKGEDSIKHYIIPVRRPNIPVPEERIEEIEVPGRSGILTISDGVYEQIVIPVEFNFMSRPDEWGKIFRRAKKWLTGSGKLVFSDDAGCFYKVLYCKIADAERTSRRIGTFTAEFTCDPYTYYADGEKEVQIFEEIYNPGAKCCPVYRITGEGLCTITVNNNTFRANIGQEIIIDSGLMLTYKNDGTSRNTDVIGDYKDLWLMPGDNAISATPGFSVFMKPGWRDL